MQIVHNSTAYEIAHGFAQQAHADASAAFDAVSKGAPLPSIAPQVARASQAARDAEYALKYVQGTMDAGAWLPEGKSNVTEGVRMLHATEIRLQPNSYPGDSAQTYLGQAVDRLGSAVREIARGLEHARAEEAAAANAVKALDAAVVAGR